MPSAKLRHPNEHFDAMFRRFKRAVERDGTLQRLREKEFYVKPSIRRKLAKAAARKRHLRERAEEREAMSKGLTGQ
jgi:small subunit ribosomal protein S21